MVTRSIIARIFNGIESTYSGHLQVNHFESKQLKVNLSEGNLMILVMKCTFLYLQINFWNGERVCIGKEVPGVMEVDQDRVINCPVGAYQISHCQIISFSQIQILFDVSFI